MGQLVPGCDGWLGDHRGVVRERFSAVGCCTCLEHPVTCLVRIPEPRSLWHTAGEQSKALDVVPMSSFNAAAHSLLGFMCLFQALVILRRAGIINRGSENVEGSCSVHSGQSLSCGHQVGSFPSALRCKPRLNHPI